MSEYMKNFGQDARQLRISPCSYYHRCHGIYSGLKVQFQYDLAGAAPVENGCCPRPVGVRYSGPCCFKGGASR